MLTLDPTTFPEDAEVPQTDSRVVPTKGQWSGPDSGPVWVVVRW